MPLHHDSEGTIHNHHNHHNHHASSPQTESTPYSAFSRRQQYLIVFIVALAATFSGLASNVYFPALPAVAKDLNVSVGQVNLSVTGYLIFQGLAPSLWGPLSDAKGRRLTYICTFLVFIGACVGLAQTKNYTSLMVLRCLQSTGSASTIALGSGVIGDFTTPDERGGFMGIFQAGQLVALAVGPIIGGGLAGSLGWRAIFWFLTIYAVTFFVAMVLLLPETLRSIVGNGTEIPSNIIYRYPLLFYIKTSSHKLKPTSPKSTPAKTHMDITGPFRILFSKQAAPIIIFLATYYTVWQMSITSISTLFESRYGLDESQIGLTYIANGAGSMIGTLVMGKILDHDYRKVKDKFHADQDNAASDSDDNVSENELLHRNDELPLEEARLRLIPIAAVLQCLSVLLFGWTVHFPDKVHIAVPIVSTFITGWTAIATQSTIMTYMVDVFPKASAAASASLNLARCLCAAGGTSAIAPLMGAVGVGPAFSVCAGVQLVALLGVVVQRRYGGHWRVEAERKSRGEITLD